MESIFSMMDHSHIRIFDAFLYGAPLNFAIFEIYNITIARTHLNIWLKKTRILPKK